MPKRERVAVGVLGMLGAIIVPICCKGFGLSVNNMIITGSIREWQWIYYTCGWLIAWLAGRH